MMRLVLLFSFLNGCSSKKLTLVSNERANISLVDFSDDTGEGELVGETPTTLDVSDLDKKYIRVWGDGIQSQYWVVSPLSEAVNELNLRLEYKEEEDQEEDIGIKTNRQFRMLMRAYQALSSKNWKQARELAKQLMREVPEAAAPYVITGLAFLAESQKSRAKTEFLKAKNLDPEDRDLERLLSYTK